MDALAFFDGRTHHLDGANGVLEYLRWRQADAMKNSVGMLASHHFSHRALTGVRVRDRKAMLDGIGVDWKSLAQEVRQGTFVRREVRDRTVTYFHTKEQVTKTLDLQRHEWTASAAPYFNSVESLGLTPDASTLPGIST